MINFSREQAEKILKNEIDVKTLALQYPELEKCVLEEIATFNKDAKIGDGDVVEIIDKYKKKASYAVNQIRKSGRNKVTVDTFLPEIIKARIAIYLIDQLYMVARAKKTEGAVRLNLWDGTILQKLLFKKGLERKPVSNFWFGIAWPFIMHKNVLMPLVYKKGIYCFYSKKLIRELGKLIGTQSCIEIGAGDGTLTRFLNAAGVNCKATDDYSWSDFIDYPDQVEKMSAKEALQHYKPEVVICSWTPPGNDFEQEILRTESVKMYIVLGTKNPDYSGNHLAYEKQERFEMVENKALSKLILPPSSDYAVYVFQSIQ